MEGTARADAPDAKEAPVSHGKVSFVMPGYLQEPVLKYQIPLGCERTNLRLLLPRPVE